MNKNLHPERVELGDFGTVVIYDREGVRLEYACDSSGNMVLGRVIRYSWNWPATEERPDTKRCASLEIAMFVPLAPYCVPWLLKVTE